MNSLHLTETHESMVKPFFKDEYATVELDDTIPCVKLTLNGIPRYSEHYQFVQTKRLQLMHEQIRNYPKLHMLAAFATATCLLASRAFESYRRTL